jgi:hypothetical protein
MRSLLSRVARLEALRPTLPPEEDCPDPKCGMSLRSRLRGGLERSLRRCPEAAHKQARTVVVRPGDPEPTENDLGAGCCEACGKPLPVVVVRLVYDPDFFHNKDRLDDLAASST